MIRKKSDNIIYMLTIEYNRKTEEIEYIAEEIVDDTDIATHISGTIDLEEQEWDIDALEFMRKHYISGEA